MTPADFRSILKKLVNEYGYEKIKYTVDSIFELLKIEEELKESSPL